MESLEERTLSNFSLEKKMIKKRYDKSVSCYKESDSLLALSARVRRKEMNILQASSASALNRYPPD